MHAQLVARPPGLVLAAVCSRTAERRAQAEREHPGIRTYESYEALLGDASLDLVVVATPHDVHEPMVVAAARAGKHVVTDKIMALSVAEGERMIAACRQAGVLFSVFHNRRWDSDYLTVRRVLEQGTLGEVFTIDSAVTSYRPYLAQRDAGELKGPSRWREYARHGGGPFRDWGAHLFDQAVQLCGTRAESVWADLQFRVPALDVETAGQATLRFPAAEDAPDDAPAYAGTRQLGANASGEGIRYTIEAGGISAIPRPRWYVRGSRGAYIQYGLDPQEAALHRGEVGPRPLPPESAPRLVLRDGRGAAEREVPVEVVPGNWPAFYENIAAYLRGEAPVAVQPENVLCSLRLIEAALDSARRIQVVRPL